MGGENIKDIIAAAARDKKGEENIKDNNINLKETTGSISTPSLNTIVKKEINEEQIKEVEEDRTSIREKELGVLKRIENHSKGYNGNTYINVKVKAISATKLKLISSSCSLTQQAIISYLIEDFLEKKQIKNLVEQIKNELD